MNAQECSANVSTQSAIMPRAEEIKYPGRDWPVFCLMPGCTAQPFNRSKDLQRHYKNVHAADSLKDSYLCDYPNCTRSREPFHRRDHLRDHLQECHREYIEKRGDAANEDWLEGRYLPKTWWRCPRCLVRVYIAKHGFGCPGCRTPCGSERKETCRRPSELGTSFSGPRSRPNVENQPSTVGNGLVAKLSSYVNRLRTFIGVDKPRGK